jgi:hypothetical protein
MNCDSVILHKEEKEMVLTCQTTHGFEVANTKFVDQMLL